MLNDAEEDLRDWQPNVEPVHTSAHEMGANLMPASVPTASVTGEEQRSAVPGRLAAGVGEGELGHLQQVEQGQGQGQSEAPSHREMNEGFATEQQQYAQSETGQSTILNYR